MWQTASKITIYEAICLVYILAIRSPTQGNSRSTWPICWLLWGSDDYRVWYCLRKAKTRTFWTGIEVILFPSHDGQVFSPSLLSPPDVSDSSKFFLSWSFSQELRRAWWSIYFDKSVSRAIKEIVSAGDFLLSKDLALYYRLQYFGFQNKPFSAFFFLL